MSENFEPIKILEIVAEDVTKPRNDGTRGSALYAVPFKLSRTPPSDWCSLFLMKWASPRVFSSMHRSSICKIRGDRIVLDGTTLEEVQSYHKKTLMVCLEDANAAYAAVVRERESERTLQEENDRACERHVEDVASKITFDD